MAVSVTNVIGAYARQAKVAAGPGMEPRGPDPAQSFAELLGGAADSAIAAGKNAEQMTAKAIAGKAELSDVVTAVTSAEVTLQTALAVRDRVIQAYQDILRMPI